MYNFQLNAPLTINMSLSFRCNFSCKHCYSREEKRPELGMDDLRKIADTIARWKVPFLNLGGGEPLIVPHLYEFVRYATEKGLHCSMNSNGYILDKQAARDIRQAGFRSVGISIDSAREDVHDGFRNKKGSFKKACAALSCLAEEGVKTTVSMVITKLSHRDFGDIIPLCREHSVKQLFLHNYKCSGFGYKNMEELDLAPDEWKEFYRNALRIKESSKDLIISFDDPIMHLLPEYNDRPLVKGSTCGKLSLNIRPDGDITPCGFMSVVIGNILKDDIMELWKSSPVLLNLRNPKPHGKCEKCAIYENCLGGCKARAYMITGDFHNPDPHCWKKGGE